MLNNIKNSSSMDSFLAELPLIFTYKIAISFINKEICRNLINIALAKN
jgi:hypothetical protein